VKPVRLSRGKKPVEIGQPNFGAAAELEIAVAQSQALTKLLLDRAIEDPCYEEGSKTKEYFDFGLQNLASTTRDRLLKAEEKVTELVIYLSRATPQK